MDFKTLSYEDRTAIEELHEFIKTLKSHTSEGRLLFILDDDQQTQLLTLAKRISLAPLIRLAIEDSEVGVLCKHASLEPLWNERWRLSGRNPSEMAKKNNQPVHEYLPQPTLATFQLLQGIFLYSQYKTAGDDSLIYLHEAAEMGNFPALNTLTTECLNTPDLHHKALVYANIAADLHWTPGYLLLAVVECQLKHYVKALLHLIIAEKLLPYSEAMINNAYQGQSLETIAKPLMLSLGVHDWMEAKVKLAHLSHLPLLFVTTRLYTQADRMVEEIRARVNRTEEADEANAKDSVSPGF